MITFSRNNVESPSADTSNNDDSEKAFLHPGLSCTTAILPQGAEIHNFNKYFENRLFLKFALINWRRSGLDVVNYNWDSRAELSNTNRWLYSINVH